MDFLFLFLMILNFTHLVQGIDEQLVMVQVIWRHGDRAPVSNYPTDIHNESAWPNGFGELTELGIRHQFELGQRLRQRYVGRLLSNNYDAREVYIQSTDKNRTLMSALANLAGMFESSPGMSDVANWPKGWMPIPVHIVADNDTSHIFASCPRADQLDLEIQNSSSHLELVEENQNFFSFLTNMTGKPINIQEIFDLHDTYWIEKSYNLSQPDWLTDQVAKHLRNLSDIDTRFDNGVGEPYVPELIRLRGGRLLKAMIERMVLKVDCLNGENGRECGWIDHLKYHAFSAHDTTIYAILATLGNPEKMMNSEYPPYCSTIAIELWMLDKTANIKILFGDTPITQMIDGCPPDSPLCPLDMFTQRSAPFLPNDILKECEAK